MGGMLSGAIVSVMAISLWDADKITKVHTLQQPLIVMSGANGGAQHILPIGTTLYFDRSFPEGFTRYRIYVNVDRIPLGLHELADPAEIDPLEARAFDKSALALALRGYPLSRAEIAAILRSPQLTEKDVQAVFNEYLERHQ